MATKQTGKAKPTDKRKAPAKRKQASGWKGGSFKAAVGMYAKKKLNRASVRWRKALVKGFASILGVKGGK